MRTNKLGTTEIYFKGVAKAIRPMRWIGLLYCPGHSRLANLGKQTAVTAATVVGSFPVPPNYTFLSPANGHNAINDICYSYITFFFPPRIF